MDRERLKEVHQTDLTESRVNEDFVDWLKDKGPTWLLVILVAVTVYLGLVRWRQHQARKTDVAWAALSEAALPGSKEDVADQHDGIWAVPELALISAGSQLLAAVQADRPIEAVDPGTAPDPNAPPLTESDRTAYLERADRIFQRVQERDDGSLSHTLHALHAISGRAAVAEARGDLDAARALLEQSVQRAGTYYPDLAAQARGRLDTLDDLASEITLATAAPTPRREPTIAPATIEAGLADLLTPPEDAESDG